MAILPKSGRAAIAKAVKDQQIFVAWGEGIPSWGTTPPAEDENQTDLHAEIGRRKATEAYFVVPDVNGDIEIAGSGVFSRSANPTQYLLIVAKFMFAEGADETVREIGGFIGTVVDPTLPPGQQYFTPDQVDDKGQLLFVENRSQIIRSQSTREQFETLVIF